ncbi:hypothetical protein [Xanthomonas hortorum]|uniref:hypothetical protein n=1 Tax=Xanthomonas hortorum TaxID=56454 RepID=UPI002042E2F5|nr:hypothetical protein [Xanthomonas hortorum]MCM5624690.1 hypothetical protein [Xanthomonas hortorum pv. pelargonii]MCM5645789.1 hypothetical protein [Xanthomonas hortorum pv. pelargonii]MCM5650369.1 hypothetical protein [Xanthomonas hortorum pv. pelargonii]
MACVACEGSNADALQSFADRRTLRAEMGDGRLHARDYPGGAKSLVLATMIAG